MRDEFHRPAATGQRITCDVTTESVSERHDGYEIRSRAVCSSGAGTVVTAEYRGVIRTGTDTGL